MLVDKCFTSSTAVVLSFIFCTILCLGAGTLYMFSAYSREMEEVVAEQNPHTHVNVELVGSIGDLGLYLGVIAGIVYDRFGCTIANIYGMLLTSTGYLLVYLSLAGYIRSQVPLLCLFFFFIGQGSYAMYINAYSTTIKNVDKKHGGKVSGYFLAVYGSSSILFTFLYDYALQSNVIKLFFLFFVMISWINVVAMFTVGVLSKSEEHEEEHFVKNPEVNEIADLNAAETDITGLQLAKRVDFWLLFFDFVLITGVGLMWKNVLGTVNKAFDINVQSSMVITWSIVNTVARLLIGVLSDVFAHRVRRALWLMPFLILNFLSSVAYFISPSVGILWFINIASGLGYGAGFSMFGGLIAVNYGRKYIGINAGIGSLAPAIGGTSFTAISVALTGSVTNATSGDCIGSKCYEGTFMFACVTLAVAMCLTLLLAYVEDVKRFVQEHILDRCFHRRSPDYTNV